MNAHAHCYLPYPDSPVPHADSGPLGGLSFAVKDLFDVAGYPTGCGNPHKLAASGLKSSHAPVVRQLLAAGACFTAGYSACGPPTTASASTAACRWPTASIPAAGSPAS